MAIRVAQPFFEVNHWLMNRIDMEALKSSGIPILRPSRTPTPLPDPLNAKYEPPQQSSQTTQGRCPRGTRDNPFGVDNLCDESPIHKKYLRIESIPPDKFNGNRAKTHQFLTQFKRFMMMNQQATIAKDPISRSAYFLSLIKGPEANAWVEHQYEWLNQIEGDPQLLPY
jgi:hypothetical protein